MLDCNAELGFCSYETTNETIRGVFQWNETAVNTNTSTSCIYRTPGVMGTRQCASRDMWADPYVDLCRTVVSEWFNMLEQVSLSEYS